MDYFIFCLCRLHAFTATKLAAVVLKSNSSSDLDLRWMCAQGVGKASRISRFALSVLKPLWTRKSMCMEARQRLMAPGTKRIVSQYPIGDPGRGSLPHGIGINDHVRKHAPERHRDTPDNASDSVPTPAVLFQCCGPAPLLESCWQRGNQRQTVVDSDAEIRVWRNRHRRAQGEWQAIAKGKGDFSTKA
jgi:hypothetical protein